MFVLAKNHNGQFVYNLNEVILRQSENGQQKKIVTIFSENKIPSLDGVQEIQSFKSKDVILTTSSKAIANWLTFGQVRMLQDVYQLGLL